MFAFGIYILFEEDELHKRILNRRIEKTEDGLLSLSNGKNCLSNGWDILTLLRNASMGLLQNLIHEHWVVLKSVKAVAANVIDLSLDFDRE